MENLKIGEGLFELNAVVDVIEDSPSFTQLLENWKHFARKLGVSDTKILTLSTQLNVGTTHIQDIPHELLGFWRAEKGDRATLKSLCNALAKCRIQDISESLEREYWLEAVKSLKIKLPNEVVILGDLLRNASEGTYQQIYDELKKSTYTQPIQLLKDNVDPKEEFSYYIPRTLSYTNEINEEIFRAAPKEHILLVKGVTKNELAKLSGYKPIDVSGNQFDEITVRFMVLERDEDFKRIREKAVHPVHFIEYRNGSYIWIRSKGGLDTIQRFKTANINNFGEDELIEEIMNTPPPIAVCISDSPGMGKSVLLANLALKIKKKDNSIVILIILDELAKQITHPINSPHSAIAAIAEFASEDEVIKLVLEVWLKSVKQNFDLFFDAYDEVGYDHRHVVDALLKYLSELPNFRIFVTTRTHLGHHLEDVLNVLSYDILPFNESNQVEFLKKYWIDKHGAKQGELIENYARECLKTLHEHMMDTERGIAGIPLQCRMLAEVLGKDAERASTIFSESTKSIKITSLFDMYKNLVDLKFERLSEESGNQLNHERTIYFNNHVYYSTMLLFPDWAEKLKPCLHFEGFTNIDENKFFSVGLMEKTLDSSTPRFIHRTFAEYLLAEFLVVNEHSECVEMTFRNVVGGTGVSKNRKHKYGTTSFCMQHPVMAYFINMHLKQRLMHISMNELVITVSKHRSKIALEDLGKTIAACTCQDLETLFRISMELFQGYDIISYDQGYIKIVWEEYFRRLLHFTADMYSSEKLIKKVIDFMNLAFGLDISYYKCNLMFKDKKDTIVFTPLHVAAGSGKYNIVTYLLQEYGERIKNLKYLLHFGVTRSSENSEFVIQDKLSILDFLEHKTKEYNLNWVDEELGGCPPLLVKNVHMKILDRLIGMGANINAFTKEEGTVLHTSGNSDSWKELLRWALSKGFKLINYINHERETSFLIALKKKVAIDEETLDFLHLAGADFNSVDKDGNSVLFYSLISQNTEVISKIIDFGANVNHENKSNNNAAHFLIRMYRGKDSDQALIILNLLISKRFKLLNQSNSKGVSPFEYMIENVKYFDNPQLFDFFNSNGADFNAKYNCQDFYDLFHLLFGFVRTKTGREPKPVLFYTIGKISYASIAKIIECGGDVNYVNTRYQNAAHITIRNSIQSELESEEVIKLLNLLIMKGFTKIDEADISGDTPLLFAVKAMDKMDENILNFFYRRRVNINAMGTNGFSVLFWAVALHKNVAVISKLLEYGGDMHHLSKNKWNALHVAAYHRNSSALELFIDKFDINSATQNGSTPLNLLVLKKEPLDEKLLDLFHDKGANFNAANDTGFSVLFSAIEGNQNPTILTKILEYGANLYHLSSKKSNVLHIAAYNRNSSALELFIDKFDINSATKNGSTPLHRLVLKKEPLAKKLLDLFHDKGANFNAANDTGFSVLFSAIEGNQNPTILTKILEYGANLNHLSSEKSNVLHIATCHRNTTALELFIDKFDINSATQTGSTPLHQLVLNKEPLDEKLLDIFHAKGANFNAADNNGFSVLFSAIKGNQNQTILTKILEYGANLNHLSSKKSNALHIAALHRNTSALELFIDKFDIHSKDQYGSTPVHNLVNKEESLDIKLLDLFHKRGANFNAANVDLSVLFGAIRGRQSSIIISKIVEYGGDPHCLQYYNRNALLIASQYANSSALEFLLEKFEYNIDAVDDYGNTPLHAAFFLVSGGYSEVLKLLLKHDFQFDIKNNDGHIPLVRWIIEGENPFPTLIELQDLLPITNDITSNSLTALIQQDILLREYLINSSVEKKETFEKFFDLLISKGGKLLGKNGSKIDWTEFCVERFAVIDQILAENHQLDEYVLERNYQTLALTTESNSMNFSSPTMDQNIPIEILLKGLLNTKQYDVFYSFCSELSNIICNKKFLADEFFSDEFDINSVGGDKLTPLLRLVSSEQPVRVKLLKLFHKKGANFNAADENGSVLFHAIRSNQSSAPVSHIIHTFGGDAYYRDARNNNALHIAASYANFSALEYLLHQFQDFNHVNDDGDTPMHKVFTYEDKDYRDVLDLLLKEKCSDFKIENKKGYTPLVNWIVDGKNNIPTLLELQDLLPITSEIASSTLTALLQQENLLQDHLLNSSEQKKYAFEKFFKLLKCKGGKLLRKDGSKIEWEKVSGESFPILDKIGMEVVPEGYLRIRQRRFHSFACLCSVLIVLFAALVYFPIYAESTA